MPQKHTKASIVKRYIALAKRLGSHPTRSDLLHEGISRDNIRHHFTNLSVLKDEAREHEPNAFSNVIDDEFFSIKRQKALSKDLKSHSRFVITTAIGGSPIDEKFYTEIKRYCKENDAKLLVLFCADTGSSSNHSIDPALLDEHVVTHDVALNSNVFISTIKLGAKQVDPVTGLGRIGQRDGTFIYASPKQRLKSIPTSNEKPPHILVTTGAITKPTYLPKAYMNSRTSYLANHDHVMGALIVEVVNNKYYHIRHTQFVNGGMVDLGKLYKNGKTTKLAPEAFVLGDSHAGETDMAAENAWHEAFEYTGCKDVVLHDLFSGISISHHELEQGITRAQRAEANELNLEQEFRIVADYLNRWTKKARKVVVVDSNHHDFLVRYLNEGIYHKDSHNLKIASKLIAPAIEGKNPLQFAVEELIGLDHPERVIWLSIDQDYKMSGIELGAHGHRGANGSRGSLRAMEEAYGNSVSGHAHTVEILRGAWQVGTTSHLKLKYNRGASSWLHASCLVYPNSARQMVIAINGSWRLKD